MEADVNNTLGQSVKVKITDSTESQNEVFSLAGADDKVYPFDISLYPKESSQKVQPKEGYSVKTTLPVPEKLLEDREQIKVVYGNGMFGPEDNITREQMIAVLWRYAGSPVAADSEGLNTFKDAVKISSYSKNALAWAHKEGIIAGKGNGILNPKGYATRAEVATIIINYVNTTEK